MDVVETAAPVLTKIPFASGDSIKALYFTGNIIVIQASDLKTFAIRTGVAAAYAGLGYWSWHKQVKPWVAERKERKERKARLERLKP